MQAEPVVEVRGQLLVLVQPIGGQVADVAGRLQRGHVRPSTRGSSCPRGPRTPTAPRWAARARGARSPVAQSSQLTDSTGCSGRAALGRSPSRRSSSSGCLPVKRSHWACVISYFERKKGRARPRGAGPRRSPLRVVVRPVGSVVLRSHLERAAREQHEDEAGLLGQHELPVRAARWAGSPVWRCANSHRPGRRDRGRSGAVRAAARSRARRRGSTGCAIDGSAASQSARAVSPERELARPRARTPGAARCPSRMRGDAPLGSADPCAGRQAPRARSTQLHELVVPPWSSSEAKRRRGRSSSSRRRASLSRAARLALAVPGGAR